ncbi:hypothetical protein [Polycladidibacter stylochi]|uniref:hypothetical protein n=1 Tax=Polycladidibacter stylochi TaxID=1807766 RepID=UPI00082DB18F|nr:hypothetical protein [Pseudovibrio stylochi]
MPGAVTSKERIKQLADYAKHTNYKGYMLDIKPGSFTSKITGIGPFTNIQFHYSAYAIIASSEGGKPLAQAQCTVNDEHDLSEFNAAGSKLANSIAVKLGKECANEIIAAIF